MKAFKAICTATILALALSVPTYAGDVLTPGLTSPVPETPIVTPGEINSPGITSTNSGAAETSGLFNVLVAIISIF